MIHFHLYFLQKESKWTISFPKLQYGNWNFGESILDKVLWIKQDSSTVNVGNFTMMAGGRNRGLVRVIKIKEQRRA